MISNQTFWAHSNTYCGQWFGAAWTVFVGRACWVGQATAILSRDCLDGRSLFELRVIWIKSLEIHFGGWRRAKLQTYLDSFCNFQNLPMTLAIISRFFNCIRYDWSCPGKAPYGF